MDAYHGKCINNGNHFDGRTFHEALFCCPVIVEKRFSKTYTEGT